MDFMSPHNVHISAHLSDQIVFAVHKRSYIRVSQRRNQIIEIATKCEKVELVGAPGALPGGRKKNCLRAQNTNHAFLSVRVLIVLLLTISIITMIINIINFIIIISN